MLGQGLLLLFTLGAGSLQDAGGAQRVGRPMPSLRFHPLTGGTLLSDSFAGRPVLYKFGPSW